MQKNTKHWNERNLKSVQKCHVEINCSLLVTYYCVVKYAEHYLAQYSVDKMTRSSFIIVIIIPPLLYCHIITTLTHNHNNNLLSPFTSIL